MIELAPRNIPASVPSRIGVMPIAIAAVALFLVVIGIGSIALWRAYTGTSPEQDRTASARQLQVRTAQASEQLIEKTKGLETSQQESIDQLQVVQDQLLTVKRLLTAQQNEAKRLTEQVQGLTGAVDGLRQSFASAQSAEVSSPPSTRKPLIQQPARATRGRLVGAHPKPPRSPG